MRRGFRAKGGGARHEERSSVTTPQTIRETPRISGKVSRSTEAHLTDPEAE